MRLPSNNSESGNSTAEFEDDQGNQLEIQVDNPINKPSTDLTAKDRTVSVEDVEASEEAKARVLKWHILKPNQRTPQQICNEEYQVLEDYARMVQTFIAIATEIDHKKDKQWKPEDWYVVRRALDALDDDQADTSESESEVLISHFFKTKQVPLDLHPTVDHADAMLVLVRLYNQLHAAERAKLGASEPSLPELPLSDQNVAEGFLLHHIDEQKLAALKGERASVSTTPTAKSKLNLIEAVRANLAAVRKTTLALGAQALRILKHFKPLKWETAADLGK
ncbi:hypothetical protein OC846_006616 [Tilletia horrida]|uniref:Uncharacterized protein n=1 Tax=Tilletia horrida TaxID=155126 RepID=A0AAN6JP77_9BASI|nr:hypothetical protein OC846_006616 [Tilletia horrida]